MRTIEPKKSVYISPAVNFDKNVWTIKKKHSFFGLIGTLRNLFRAIDVEENSFSLKGHRRAIGYRKGNNSVTVYYHPRNSLQPSVRIVMKSNENESLPLEILQDYLEKNKFVVEITQSQTSLNVEFPEDSYNPITSSTLAEDARKLVRKALKNEKMRIELLEKLDSFLIKSGYEFQSDSKVKKPDSHEYTNLTIFDTDWFRINCSYSPINQYFPYASIQIDNFKKEYPKYSYWSLLFILRILKLYEIDQSEHFEVVTVKPSLIEISFDFYNYRPDFILELNSSIYCDKRKFGWSNQPELPFNDYKEDDDVELLLGSTHYIGKRKNPDYQIRMYNKSDVPRLEFAIKNKILRVVKADCIEDLFTKDWILDFFHGGRINSFRINYYRIKDKALERVDSCHHYLANRSLKAFISKIPKNKKANLLRDCFEEDIEFREVVEESAKDFHRWLKDLYLNGSIMVLTKDGLNVQEEIFGESNVESIIDGNRVKPFIGLKELLQQLPSDTSVETQEHDSFIRFTIRDNQHNILAHIIIGELPEQFLESGDIYFIEHFKDVFSKPKSSVQVDVAGF